MKCFCLHRPITDYSDILDTAITERGVGNKNVVNSQYGNCLNAIIHHKLITIGVTIIHRGSPGVLQSE